MLGLSDYVADEVRKLPEGKEVAQGDTKNLRTAPGACDIAIETREGSRVGNRGGAAEFACWCLSLSAPDPVTCFSSPPYFPPFSVSLQSFQHSNGDDSLSLGIDLDRYIDEVHHDRSVMIGQGGKGREGKEKCGDRLYYYAHAASII